MLSPFVQPGIVRLPLEADQWIDVKRELNVGEWRAMMAAMMKAENDKADPAKVPVVKVLAYLLAWSFTDEDGTPVPVTAGALDSMRVSWFHAIRQAIDNHETAVQAKESEKKTVSSGPINSDRISMSVE